MTVYGHTIQYNIVYIIHDLLFVEHQLVAFTQQHDLFLLSI